MSTTLLKASLSAVLRLQDLQEAILPPLLLLHKASASRSIHSVHSVMALLHTIAAQEVAVDDEAAATVAVIVTTTSTTTLTDLATHRLIMNIPRVNQEKVNQEEAPHTDTVVMAHTTVITDVAVGVDEEDGADGADVDAGVDAVVIVDLPHMLGAEQGTSTSLLSSNH